MDFTFHSDRAVSKASWIGMESFEIFIVILHTCFSMLGISVNLALLIVMIRHTPTSFSNFGILLKVRLVSKTPVFRSPFSYHYVASLTDLRTDFFYLLKNELKNFAGARPGWSNQLTWLRRWNATVCLVTQFRSFASRAPHSWLTTTQNDCHRAVHPLHFVRSVRIREHIGLLLRICRHVRRGSVLGGGLI